jgi:hypothetical protein
MAVNEPPPSAVKRSGMEMGEAVLFLAFAARSIPNFVVLLIGRLWYK